MPGISKLIDLYPHVPVCAQAGLEAAFEHAVFIDIVIDQGMLFSLYHPQDPSDILLYPAGKPDGCCKEDGREVFQIKSLTDELGSGNDDAV